MHMAEPEAATRRWTTGCVDLSIVVPAYNEAENLTRLVDEIRATMADTGLDWELIVVDDGSNDASVTILDRLAASEPRLHPHRLPQRCGQTAALLAGFDRARGRLLATLDADLQCRARELPLLLGALGDNAMACGIRGERDDPPSRRAASAVSNAVRRLFLAPGLRDLAGPLRVFRADALESVRAGDLLFDGAHRWLPALFHLAGFRVVQRPVSHYPRTAGVSKYTTRGRVIPIAREVIEVIVRGARFRRTHPRGAPEQLPET